MQNTQSPQTVNVQSPQPKNGGGAGGGRTRPVAEQAAKATECLGGPRDKGAGRRMTIRSFFEKEKRRQGTPGRGLHGAAFISLSTLSHVVFIGSFKTWPDSRLRFTERRIKAQRRNMTFPRSQTLEAQIGVAVLCQSLMVSHCFSNKT